MSATVCTAPLEAQEALYAKIVRDLLSEKPHHVREALSPCTEADLWRRSDEDVVAVALDLDFVDGFDCAVFRDEFVAAARERGMIA